MGLNFFQRPFFQRIVRRMAYRLADKQIRNLRSNVIEIESLRYKIDRSYWSQKSVNFNFQIGYEQRWKEL